MASEAEVRRAFALDQRFEPVAAVLRGTVRESMHRGAIACVDAEGALRGWVGDPAVPILLRSAAKPFQALAVIESGAADAFRVTEEEIAVMAGSHAGQADHVRVVKGILERCGVGPEALVCGSPAHMCSGKHAGMILLALHLGVPVAGYERSDHPVQQAVAATVRGLLARRPTGVPGQAGEPSGQTGEETDLESRRAGGGEDSALVDAGAGSGPEPPADGGPGAGGRLFAGIDGCGVPVIRMALDDAAWLFALLAAGATPGLARVRDAMRAHPELVAGKTRVDTKVMRGAPGRVVAKGGAEGVQGLAVCAESEAATRLPLGFAMKVEDGSARPLPTLIQVCLAATGVHVSPDELEETLPRDQWASRSLAVGRVVGLVPPRQLFEERGGQPTGEPEFETLDGGRVELLVGRGDEKELNRFLREEWPLSDEEVFGRQTQWIADPFALILKHKRKVLAVLKGHFLGGLASVDEFIVGREYRGQGIGSRMLMRFEEEARRRGSYRVVLRAVKGGRAEYFYRRLGYETECVQVDYEFGEDFVRLTHRLRQSEEDG